MTISVSQLSHQYTNKLVLSELSFDLQEGFNILLGPNGAGKSTLLSLLTGLRKVQTGSISFNQQKMEKQRKVILSKMGVVFQENTLDLDLSVKQNLEYFAALHGLAGAKALANIADVLDQLGLNERLNEKVRNLNGGHRRRVEIARCLLHQPRFLLLDEPTVGLDIASRRLILNFVRYYVKQHRAIVLWATHLLEEIQIEDSLLLLIDGQMKDFAKCDSLLSKYSVNNVSELFTHLTEVKGS